MLSILIQLNPGYLLGIREEDPLASHRRGSRGRAGSGARVSESPGGRREGRAAVATWVRFSRDWEKVGLDVFQLESSLFYKLVEWP